MRSNTTQSLWLAKKFIIVMAGNDLFRLFVIFLGLSHLMCLKAVPITRTESLMQVPQVHLVPENTHKVTAKENVLWEEPSFSERMDLELDDYSASGANGRHTPRVP